MWIGSLSTFNWKSGRYRFYQLTDCMICLDQFKYEDSIKMLMCLHIFHPKCIMEWLDNKAQCPICKFEVESKKDMLLTLKTGQVISYNTLLQKNSKITTTTTNSECNLSVSSLVSGLKLNRDLDPVIRKRKSHQESQNPIKNHVSSSQENSLNMPYS